MNHALLSSHTRCKRYQSKDECLRLIDDASNFRNPNIMTVDAGEVFVGGRYHSLVPILKEVYPRRDGGYGTVDFHHSVAVVKKGTMRNLETMADLRGVRACFPGVSSLAGWTMPIERWSYCCIMVMLPRFFIGGTLVTLSPG